jgi:hypothetical protein
MNDQKVSGYGRCLLKFDELRGYGKRGYRLLLKMGNPIIFSVPLCIVYHCISFFLLNLKIHRILGNLLINLYQALNLAIPCSFLLSSSYVVYLSMEKTNMQLIVHCKLTVSILDMC